MSVKSLVEIIAQVKVDCTDKPITELKNQPDYVRFEQLKQEISPDLNTSEYTNAVRQIARECCL